MYPMLIEGLRILSTHKTGKLYNNFSTFRLYTCLFFQICAKDNCIQYTTKSGQMYTTKKCRKGQFSTAQRHYKTIVYY